MLIVFKEKTMVDGDYPFEITRTWYLFGLIPIAKSIRHFRRGAFPSGRD